MNVIFDRLWHQLLGRPYVLNVFVDKGSGTPVILLHGVGRSGEIWQPLIGQLPPEKYRVVAFDLLGFGGSPKPDWPKYNVNDHARAVLASIKKLKLDRPAIVVGHSMGGLVATRLAAMRPKLVRHLVLYEMPLYSGLPDKRSYRLRLNFYFKIYKRILKYQPPLAPKFRGSAKARNIAEQATGYKLSNETWLAFVRSLEHTIMDQNAAREIKTLPMPIDIIYGSRDRLVIRGKTQEIFGEDAGHITGHTIRERHKISQKAARFLAGRIEAAITGYPPVKQ